MVKAHPRAFRDESDGRVLPGDTITQMRNQLIGEEKGLRELSKVLAQREHDLRQKLKQQDT